jgi:hypothetical protein
MNNNSLKMEQLKLGWVVKLSMKIVKVIKLNNCWDNLSKHSL